MHAHGGRLGPREIAQCTEGRWKGAAQFAGTTGYKRVRTRHQNEHVATAVGATFCAQSTWVSATWRVQVGASGLLGGTS